MAHDVLVIEDQKDIAELIKLHLAEIDCQVHLAFDGSAGLAEARLRSYDIVILDIMLPGENGLDICRYLRAETDRTRILMLTARSTEFDRVLGLELGADDYLTKPFSVRELIARVKVQLRRLHTKTETRSAPPLIRAGDMIIDTRRRELIVEGRPIELTVKEFDLLLHLAHEPGRVFTRAELLDSVWGYGHAGYEHTVNSHINRLRGKIEKDPAKPSYVRTVWGYGYKFEGSSKAQ
jgi:two-component system OmpR family response regulator